ncbi:MAG: hypothetical protein WCD76_03350, partial [Pyrinomonadaceae bacterium]
AAAAAGRLDDEARLRLFCAGAMPVNSNIASNVASAGDKIFREFIGWDFESAASVRPESCSGVSGESDETGVNLKPESAREILSDCNGYAN